MSRKFLVLSALALGLIVPASAKVYTRDEAVQTAMENSADIKTAEEDLIMAAVNSAVKKKDDAQQASISDITGGMKIPGLM